MTKATGRKQALVGLTATALLGLGIFAPAASAQVNLGDPVGSTTGSGGGGTTTKVTETVKDTTSPVVNTGGSTGGEVIDTVDKVGSGVDNATGGTTYEKTKDAVKDTTAATGDAVKKTAGDVGQTVEDTSGGLVTNPDLNVENPLGNRKNRKRAGGNQVTGPRSKNGTAGGRTSQVAAARDARQDAAANKRFGSLSAADRNRDLSNFAPASAVAPQRDSFMSNLAEAARDAATKLAFPLGLALMVGAFLMVQGRIDRKDAKLALAPIDSEQDLLSFQ